MSDPLSALLRQSSLRHDHLCPRQVLGVRMGLLGSATMGWVQPVTSAMGMIIVETDGCFVDGLEVATGATAGHRTLRIHDLGKIAATFADVRSGRALRIWPQQRVRDRACEFAPEEEARYLAQLQGYQRMPDRELFHVQAVWLEPTAEALLSTPAARAVCSRCGEEIFNERQLVQRGEVVCRHCAGTGYYAVDLSSERIPVTGTSQLPSPIGGADESTSETIPIVPTRTPTDLRRL